MRRILALFLILSVSVLSMAQAQNYQVGGIFNQAKTFVDVRDYGAKCDGVTNDTTTINNALAAAVAIGTSVGSAEVIFPSGVCLGNFTIIQGKGLRIHGTGELSTVLLGLGSTAALQINGLWYSSFEDMSFQVQHGITTGAVLDIDGDFDGTHTQTVQFLTFTNVGVFGAGTTDGILSQYSVSVCRRGTCQGSNLNFNNIAISGASSAGYIQEGFNALANVFLGGDFQNFSKFGAKIDTGDAAFYSTSFESQFGYDQVNNGGCDIQVNAAYYAVPIYDVRSESVALVCGTTRADIRGLNDGNSTGLIPGQHNAVTWAANTAYTVGQVLATAPTQYQQGATNWLASTMTANRYYKVTTAGTSNNGAAPNWPYSGPITDGTVVWTPQETFSRIALSGASCSLIPRNTVSEAWGGYSCQGPRDLNISENRSNVGNPIVTTNTLIDATDEFLLVDASSQNIVLTIGGGFLDGNDNPTEGHLLYIRRIDVADTSSGALNTVTINGSAAIFQGKTFANQANIQLPPDSFVLLEWTTHCNNCVGGANGWLQIGGTVFGQGNNSNFSNTAVAGAVRLNAKSGFVTSESLTTAAGGDYVLTFTNNRISQNSIVDLNVMNGTNTGGIPSIATVNTTTAGQAVIDVHNSGSTAFNGTVTLKFLVF